jgi:4'-phosphopantetheinyl transferase
MKCWPSEIDSLTSPPRVEVGAGSNFHLADDKVHVWRLSLGSLALNFQAAWVVLSRDERERANRFHFEADRRRSVIGRGYLRLLLGRILRLPAKSLRFEYGEFGKPRLTPIQEPRLEFSVSHSGDMVLIAVSRARAVGVDVEMVRADIDVDGIAERFFSINEYKSLASLAGPSGREAFFRCWTRKEAYLKARGEGLSTPLDQFDLSFVPGEETRHDPGEVKRWRLEPLAVPPGYAGAVVAEGSDWKLECRDWPPGLQNSP